MKNNTTHFTLCNKALRLGGAALLFIALFLIFSCDSSNSQSGTQIDYYYDSSSNTYHVYSELGLRKWLEEAKSDKTLNCILHNDITLTSSKENETNWTPVSKYSGTFEGEGHTITGLTIIIDNNDANTQNQGFFRSIESGGKVQNLNLKDVHIKNLDGFIGAIAGQSEEGSIVNCTVSGTISCDSGYAGGLVGVLRGGNVSSCINECTVRSSMGGQSPAFGGIAGYVFGGTISDCKNYAYINPVGYKCVCGGGIAGYISWSTKIISCSNKGNIVGRNTRNAVSSDQELNLGAIAGKAEYRCGITDCTIEEGCTIEATYNSAANTSVSVNEIAGYFDNNCTISDNSGKPTIMPKKDLSASSTL